MSTAPEPGVTSPQSKNKRSLTVNEQPKLDLELYISNYNGRTRLQRLLLIGTCSAIIGVEALKMGVREAKEGSDIKRYLDLQTPLETLAPNEPEAWRDTKWMSNTDKQNIAETHRLEAELKGYKQNLVKESIRMANEDLGKHYQAVGELGKSYEAYTRMRQDGTVAKHTVEVSKNLIEVAVEQKNWNGVLSNVQRIRGSFAQTGEDKELQPYLCIAEGLASLDGGHYYQAALSFLSTESGMGTKYNTIASPNDVAVYGGLCALATMERNELSKKVLENSNFRSYLEMEPHVRRAITFFVNSRYSTCLSVLEEYRADYLLDIYLQKHVDELYHLIRSKSIVQYFIPFSCVTLDSLNEAFASPGKTIDKELVAMIQRKDLNARIDTQNRLLIAVPAAHRVALQTSALAVAKEYENEARRRIQHMNIHGADLAIPGSKNRSGGIGDMGYNDLDQMTTRETRFGVRNRSDY